MIASILLGSLVGMFFLGIVLIIAPTYFDKKHNSVNNHNCGLKVVVLAKSGDIIIHCLSECDANNILTNLYSELSSDNQYIHIIYHKKKDNSLVNFIIKKEDFAKACATNDK